MKTHAHMALTFSGRLLSVVLKQQGFVSFPERATDHAAWLEPGGTWCDAETLCEACTTLV